MAQQIAILKIAKGQIDILGTSMVTSNRVLECVCDVSIKPCITVQFNMDIGNTTLPVIRLMSKSKRFQSKRMQQNELSPPFDYFVVVSENIAVFIYV